MAREKKSSDTPASKPASKKAAKKVATTKVAAKKPAEVVTAAAAAGPQLSTVAAQKAQPSAVQLHDEIRRRAYELFRERGGQHGSHEADWHRAESEVRSKYKA